MKNYVILDDATSDGYQLIKLTAGDHEGIIYSYGRVELIEEDDALRLAFDYNIVDYAEREIKDTFTTEIGDVLQDILIQQLAKNEVVYKGGVDENRAEDSSESDS